MKPSLSISIISFNEEENIRRTIDAIRDIASEIILVDCHSTDKTVEIAESYGVKAILHPWEGHIANKNFALEICSSDWILCLDCDEVATPELKTEILKAINNNDFMGYEINRKTVYLGKMLNYAWQPDWNLRLVHKSARPEWGGLDPHDKLSIDGKSSKLKGDLLHYSYRDLKHHFEKTIAYARKSAESYHTKGRRYSFLNQVLNPIAAFLRRYIFNLAFLDGYRGFLAGFSSFIYTFLKYAFLWELERKK